MIKWEGKILTEYVRAGQFEPYAKDVVDRVKEYIINKEVIDAGCGPGNISVALSEYADKVIGIDAQTKAIEYAKELYSDVKNLSFKVGDIFDLESNSCDVLFGVSIGRIDERNLELIRIPRKYLIFVNTLKSQYFPKRNHNEYDDTILKNGNYKYETFRLSTSFGQPFLNYDEAVDFIRRHNLSDDYEKFAKENIKEISSGFPLYLENKKNIQITVIESKNYGR